MKPHTALEQATRPGGLIVAVVLVLIGAGAWWKVRDTAGTLAGSGAPFDRTEVPLVEAASRGNTEGTPAALSPEAAAAPFEALAREAEAAGVEGGSAGVKRGSAGYPAVPSGMRATDPVVIPSLETYRAEVDADPHGTPPSVIAFSRHVARRQKLAEGNRAVRSALFEELGRCAETPDASLPSAARAFCLVRLETLARSFPSEFKETYGRRFAALHREVLGSDRPYFATAPGSGGIR